MKDILAVLREQAVMKKELTLGKVREALALDYRQHTQEWLDLAQFAT